MITRFAHKGNCTGYPRCSECWRIMQNIQRGWPPEGKRFRIVFRRDDDKKPDE